MNPNIGKTTADHLRTLMRMCSVNVHTACKRSGVTPSTFYRWQSGSTPNDETVGKMKLAILEIALSNNTLPAARVSDLEALRATAKEQHGKKKLGLSARVERLERVVKDQLGATL